MMGSSSKANGITEDPVKKAWDEVVLYHVEPSIQVRDVILESWKQCLQMGLDPLTAPVMPVLDASELKVIRQKYMELLQLAKPVIEMIKISVSGTGFILVLTDKNGTVLEVQGDKDVLDMAERNHYIPGCIRNTQTSGTNGIGLCLDLGIPIQITGAEHFNINRHPWTCSSSPIKNIKGDVIGAITLSGRSIGRHKHTLALVTAAAKFIEGQLRERNLVEKTQRLNSILNTIYSSISDGFIAMDGDHRITHLNSAASRMLDVPVHELVGRSLKERIVHNEKLIQTLEQGEYLEASEVSFKCANGVKTFMCRVDPIHNPVYRLMGNILTLAEKRQMISIAKKIGGNYAKYEFSDIKGQNKQFIRQIKMAKLAAQTSSRILIMGESGTGKELFAQAVHNHSHRRHGPFVAISCAAIPRDLIESELFGYKGGAFTGARQKGMMGKFELANGGTLFLDEINGLPLELQGKLLRVLQQNEIMRLGSSTNVPIDVRVIAASNTDLMEDVENGSFREDLYYRLNVMEIIIPPLRNRLDDLELLIDHIMSRHCRDMSMEKPIITQEAVKALMGYDWPGNIRELENVVERALLLCQGKAIGGEHLPLRRRKSALTKTSSAVTIDQGMKQMIRAALENNDGNISKAAKELNISRGTLYRKMRQLDIMK